MESSGIAYCDIRYDFLLICLSDDAYKFNFFFTQAEFIPQLENEDDTSYFDSRAERFSHHQEFEDTDTDDSPVLSSSFASYSPQYRKHCHNNRYNYGSDESNSSLNDSGGKLALDIRHLNVS